MHCVLLLHEVECKCGLPMGLEPSKRALDKVQFRCNVCTKTRSLRKGTWFENSKLQLRQIMMFVYCFVFGTTHCLKKCPFPLIAPQCFFCTITTGLYCSLQQVMMFQPLNHYATLWPRIEKPAEGWDEHLHIHNINYRGPFFSQ